ncbi:MAG TPA: DUF3795 domain-containing protein [Desulfomonilia bacterium]
MNESLTSYCGLCCADCIPSKAEFFELIDRFEAMLEQLQFEKYAELKSETDGVFNEYLKFVSVLKGMKTLRCSKPCRLGGGKAQCTIRDCVQKNGLKGCWECRERPGCSLLARLRTIHPNLDYHLDLIKELGSEKWFEKRKEHYRWQVK